MFTIFPLTISITQLPSLFTKNFRLAKIIRHPYMISSGNAKMSKSSFYIIKHRMPYGKHIFVP